MSEKPEAAVLIVSPLPPPIGGIGSWAETLLASSLQRHFAISVLDTSPASGDALRGGNHPRLHRISGSLRTLGRAFALLRSQRPAIVHINSSYYWGFLRDGAIAWMSLAFGARVLMHLHGGDFDVFLAHCPRSLRPLVYATLARCDRVIVLTRQTETMLAQRLEPERVRYLPNFVRPELFKGNGGASSDRARVQVLFVGWVIETKGVRELLEVARRMPEARFTLCGPIDEAFRSSIAAELDSLGERVSLLGRVEHAELRTLYSRFDVFVLPTHREGFPVSVLEAMAAGLPVLATPVGAIPDAIREGVEGFLVPVGDVDALEAKLRTLVEAPDLRRSLGAAARERVEGHFAVEIVVSELCGMYRELLEAGAPRSGAA